MSEHLIISICQAVGSVAALIAVLLAQARTHAVVRKEVDRNGRVADEVARLALLTRAMAQWLEAHPPTIVPRADIDDLHL